MIHISKVYTRTGDAGETRLVGGTKVPKHAQRVATYGDVDELNSVIGMIRLELGREPTATANQAFVTNVDAALGRIQQELFNLGAELSNPGAATGNSPVIEDRHVERLEQELDAHNAPLPALKSFVLPGGGPTGSAAHLGRTVCRRAERNATALAAGESVRPQALRYLNRLSDYLFVLARAAARTFGHEETLWDPKST